MKALHLNEYGSSDPIALTSEQIRALKSFAGKISLEPAQASGEYIVKTEQWIGKCKVPGLAIEIRPKIGTVNALKMFLMGDGEASPDVVEALNRASNQDDFWDLVSELLINTVYSILKDGIRREYKEIDENSQFLRGQLLVSRDFVQNFPVRTGTLCRHAELTHDIPINQAIVWALETLSYLVGRDMAHRIRIMSHRLSEITLTSSPPEFDHRLEEGNYRLALFLTELVKSSLHSASATFGLSGFGLMMDMNKVFEGYVRRQIRDAASEYSLTVPSKGSTRRPLCDNIMLEPDFLVCNGRQIVAICDCKYKVNWRFLNSDVYQMLAYLEGYQTIRTAIIVYPESHISEISYDAIKFPRSGKLYRLGLPSQRLFDKEMWKDAIDHVVRFIGIQLSNAEINKDLEVQLIMARS